MNGADQGSSETGGFQTAPEKRGAGDETGVGPPPSKAPGAGGGGRSLYSEYIKEQLESQEATKASLEQRGLAVISTSGVLVTLLFGLTALSVEGDGGYDIPATAAVFLVGALVFFVLAAVGAIVTNLPRSYEAVTVAALRDAVGERWDDNEATASKMVALTRLKVLASAKDVNAQKGVALIAAMSFEILAVALVGVAMAFVLWE